MATSHHFRPSSISLLLLLLLPITIIHYSKAASIPDKLSSAQPQEVTSRQLDLSNLSLPPEVITEALFSQTDFLQDQLEQCEERVRNNLKGDDTAETEGIDDDDDDDDEEDDDDGDDDDDLNRKIAQLAVNAFNRLKKNDVMKKETSEGKKDDDVKQVSDDASANRGESEDADSDDNDELGDGSDKEDDEKREGKGQDNIFENNNNNNNNSENNSNEDDNSANNTTTTVDTSENEELTTMKPETTETLKTQTTPPVQKPTESEQPQDGDKNNDSEDIRTKRSVSLDPAILSQTGQRPAQSEGQTVNMGKGRIRRNVYPRREARTWMETLPGRDGEGDDETMSTEVNHNLLGTLLHRRAQNPAVAPNVLTPSSFSKTKSESSPTLDEEDLSSRASRSGDENDVVKMSENAWERDVVDDDDLLRDVIKMAEGSPASNVVKLAEKFLGTHRGKEADVRDEVDGVEAAELSWPTAAQLSRVRGVSRVSRVRRVRRGSVLGRGLSPERYVPLIEQLVERLSYLQHSVRVCHMLLPHQH